MIWHEEVDDGCGHYVYRVKDSILVESNARRRRSGCGGDLFQSPPSVPREYLWSVANRELKYGFVLNRALRAIGRELEDEMIQRGTKVVDGIAKNQARAIENSGQVGHVLDEEGVLTLKRHGPPTSGTGGIC